MIANPERGFYRHFSDCDALAFNQAQLTGFRTNDGESLVMCVFYLRNFTNSAISQSALDFFQRQMDTVRNAGLKVILRFAYSTGSAGTDASPAQITAHLNQLAPYLSNNKDVIAVVQAGFIGSYGEWAYSQHFGTNNLTAQNQADRLAVTNKLLQTVPSERMIQLRIPTFKRNTVGSSALTSAEAFTGSSKARLGHHNDCFLASANDWGTYSNTAVDYPYLAADSTYVPVGGETCNYAPPRSDCPTALSELAMFHWSFLNLDYIQTVLDGWRNQGCFNQVKQKLGYRFVLQNGAYSSSAKPGGAFTVNFSVQNQGWAVPYNSRDVELVLRNTANGALYSFKLAADPRRWLPGQAVTVNQTVTLPADIVKGNYTVLLNLPDPMPALRNRREYAIQLANNNVWEAATGFNNLNHTVSIAP
jgi:hypothetical protein